MHTNYSTTVWNVPPQKAATGPIITTKSFYGREKPGTDGCSCNMQLKERTGHVDQVALGAFRPCGREILADA